MRKIKIDKDLKTEAELFRARLIKDKAPNTKGLSKLLNKLRPRKHKVYKDYLKYLIDNYSAIQVATPDEMLVWIKKFEALLSKNKLEAILIGKKKFWENINTAMYYSYVQTEIFPEYLDKSGIKTCVYCNVQTCVVAEVKYYDRKEKKRNKVPARPVYQIDHFYPKSIYPYFATSFFNLYPSCATCNNIKREKKALFELYTESNDLEVFKYEIQNKELINRYLGASKKMAPLNIVFKSIKDNDKLLNNHNHFFAVQGVLEKNSDIAEELFLKSKLYSEAYKKSLVESFGNIFKDTKIIDRLIVGNYTNPDEVHKRPYSKMTQDIARQLKLID